MKRVVAYCRVSTNHEDQINSIESQKNHYLNLFKEKEYIIAEVGLLYKKDGNSEIIFGIYADEGISGTSLKRREAFSQMLRDAKLKLFDIIYVKDTRRWARNVENGTKAIKDLKECGVEVVFEEGNLSSFNPAHEITINMLLSVAQEESRNKSFAVQFGIIESQKKGKFTAIPPYGYIKKDGFLEIVQEQANIVRNIYDMYLNEGAGTGKICRWLNTNNIPTQKGTKWSQITVSRILENPIYTGKQITHTVVCEDVNRKIQKKIPESEQIKHYHAHLRIIDDVTFRLVLEEKEKRTNMFNQSTRYSNDNILSNLLYCDNCNTGMKRKKRKSYIRKDGSSKYLGYEWCCSLNDMYGKSKCDCRNALPEDELLKRIKEEIKKLKNNKTKLDEMLDKYINIYYIGRNSLYDVNGIKLDVEEIKAQIKANLKLYSKQIIDEEQYKNQNDDLKIELNEKESILNRILFVDQEIEKIRFKYNIYIKYLDEVDVDNLDNIILKRLINKTKVFTVKKGNEIVKDIRIIWNFLDVSEDDIIAESIINQII